MRNSQLSRQVQAYFNQYSKVKRVYSKALKSYVYFGLEGKTHLIYKSRSKHRPAQEQIYKMKLFPHVVTVLQRANETQSVRSAVRSGKVITYYSLCHQVDPRFSAVKVIVKKIGAGKLYFHSVMREDRGTKKSRLSETL